LLDRAGEFASRIGIDAEACSLTGFDAADVGLVDIGGDLHPVQVVGDQEQGRCLVGRRHRLS